MTLKLYRVVVDRTQSWTVEVWASSPVGAKSEALGEVECNTPTPTEVTELQAVEVEELERC